MTGPLSTEVTECGKQWALDPSQGPRRSLLAEGDFAYGSIAIAGDDLVFGGTLCGLRCFSVAGRGLWSQPKAGGPTRLLSDIALAPIWVTDTRYCWADRTLYAVEDLFCHEPRTGLELDSDLTAPSTGAVHEGVLYQPRIDLPAVDAGGAATLDVVSVSLDGTFQREEWSFELPGVPRSRWSECDDIVADATGIYCSSHEYVIRLPHGGEPVLLATRLGGGESPGIVVSDGFVYYADYGLEPPPLFRVPISGGAPEMMRTFVGADGAPTYFVLYGADREYVYGRSNEAATCGELFAMRKDSGDVAFITADPVLDRDEAVAIDESGVYYLARANGAEPMQVVRLER